MYGHRLPTSIMTRIVIIAALATMLLAFGISWLAVCVAVITVLFLVQGSLAAQTWVERKTGRKPNPQSEQYSASYFMIALGIGLPTIYLLPDIHPFGYGVTMVVTSTLGTVVAISLFGSRIHDDAEPE